VTALRAGSATDVGRVRANNQDNFLVAERLFAVADGMGGHAGGEVASLTAIDALRSSFEHEPDGTADALADAVRRANEAVWEQAHGRRELRGMGTTITAVALVNEDGEDVLTIVNVGDSRAYLFRDGSLDQLTDDHSVSEVLRRAGRLSSDEAATHPQRHMLTRVLGEKADVEVDCFRITPYQGDRLTLASDGLFNEVADEDIASILRTHDDPTEAAEKLVESALANGGRDNVTVVVIDVVNDDDRSAKASAALASSPSTMTSADAAIGQESRTPERRTQPGVAPARTPRATVAPPRSASPSPARRHRPGRRLTLRAVTFVVAVLVVLGGAVAATGWFARGGYYVGQEDGEVVIFQGRPGGLLWFDPTVADRTGLDMSDVRASNVRDIEAGKEQSSLDDARRYVRNVTKEAREDPTEPPVTVPAPPVTVTTVFPAPTPSPVTTP